jgi:Leucine-rich repeat (LRR) protein
MLFSFIFDIYLYMKGLVNLEYLYLNKNQISTIEDGAFSNLHNLKMLDLA